jgi:hypothetical protein
VDSIFKQYFITSSRRPRLVPSIVTLNIMMEACRQRGDSAGLGRYFKLLRVLGLAPDRYTFSTLVRASRSESEVMQLLGLARAQKQLTPPLLRSALLSLGALGANPSDILAVTHMLPAEHAPVRNAQTADVVVSALLQNRTSVLPCRGQSQAAGYDVAVGAVLAGDYSVSCRGYCCLFAYLRRNRLATRSLTRRLWSRATQAMKQEGAAMSLNGTVCASRLLSPV